MKTINKYRKTAQYCISGSEVQHMVLIMEFFSGKGNVCAVGKNADDHDDWGYTVRVSNHEQVADYLMHVSCFGRVEIVEKRVILNFEEEAA